MHPEIKPVKDPSSLVLADFTKLERGPSLQRILLASLYDESMQDEIEGTVFNAVVEIERLQAQKDESKAQRDAGGSTRLQSDSSASLQPDSKMKLEDLKRASLENSKLNEPEQAVSCRFDQLASFRRRY
jgi:hypothetical protein